MKQILNILRRFKSCHFRNLSCSSLPGCQQENWGNANMKMKPYKQTQSQGFKHNYKPHRYFSSESEVVEKTNNSLKSLTPNEFLSEMKKENLSRCYIANIGGELKYSHEMLENLFKEAELKELEFEHEAIFFNIGRMTGALMAAFIWKTNRGQGVGGVDYRPLTSMAELILEGNRFSKGLGIKAALAGMWAGGGKGFIISPEDGKFDLKYRQKAFLDYGDFLTSLNGCFVAGAGIGSSVSDMDNMFTGTRYVSNISPDYGGSVNSSHNTGLGVVTAMEAALEFLMMGTLEGKTVAIQGAGNVGQVIIEELLKKDVKRIFVSECNSMRADDVTDMFANKADGRLTVLKVSFEDTSIFQTPCDIFAPCARGKAFPRDSISSGPREVLNETTIPMLDTKIVCGSSNLPVETEADHLALMERKITYVTDVVPNRMGIVNKLLEPYGRVKDDPDLLKHLSRDWEHSIYQTTLRLLRYAAENNIHPEKAAYILGEELSNQLHPLFPNRTHNILHSLINTGWEKGKNFWTQRLSFKGEQYI